MRLASLALLLASLWSSSALSLECDNGAEVKDTKYCKLFTFYRNDVAPLDSRVAERLNGNNTDEVRSFALVIGVGDYPHLPGKSIEAANIDVRNLTELFQRDQNFDEVIVLHNSDATRENISYFLDDYLVERARTYNRHSRLVIAYSGHGVRAGGAGTYDGLVLHGATSISDIDHVYGLTTLRDSIERLASSHFHVLTLVNACYGGSVFGWTRAGSNMGATREPGSHAITAGPSDQLVWSLGTPGAGSIFFDALVEGVRTGNADQSDFRFVFDGAGRIVSEERLGIVRLGALVLYITGHIEGHDQRLAASGKQLYPPLAGPIVRMSEEARGSFFFLSPYQRQASVLAPHIMEQLPASIPQRSTLIAFSGVPSRPDLKIFNPPSEYLFRGIDVSQAEGDIAWKEVVRDNYDFAYIRASFRSVDPSFSSHWRSSREFGLTRGAYHRFDYCRSAAAQFETITSVVPLEADALPFAVWIDQPVGTDQQQCRSQTNEEEVRLRVLTLADQVHKHYGKVPVVYGVRSLLNWLLDERFNRYMVWFASYPQGDAPRLGAADLRFTGSNPWTLWQYTARQTVTGIGRNVDVSVFFGTSTQFEAFKRGEANVALQAALQRQ